ncbi:MAG: alpha/beta hydrolase [Proteobacteria bacterium]|nr:alpha/beta hydrolase [Pseudomonadota bacterium]
MTAGFSVRGEGKTIILLHGSMASKEQWLGFTEELIPRYKVISMDLIGYGKNMRPTNADDYCLKDESELLRSILESTVGSDTPYHLVGHSYGGVVAMHHAYHHQANVKSLTLIEPMAFHLLDKDHTLINESRQMVDEIHRFIREGNAIAGAEKFINLWMPAGTFAKISEREKMFLSEGVKKMVMDFQAAVSEPLSVDDYAKLSMPVCLIAGKASPPYSLGITEVVAAAIPGIEFHWVEGGHFSPVSHPYQVNPLIADFIGRVEAGA